MFTLKQKIIAASFKFLSYNYSLLGLENQVCEEVDRIEVLAESVSSAPNNIMCEDGVTDNDISYDYRLSCWNGDPERLSWILYTLAELEGGLKKNVHEGNCGAGECDPIFKEENGYKVLVGHRARTLWQLHKTNFMTFDQWDDMVGSDLQSTTLAATIAGREISWFKSRCKTESGALSIYATGKSCKWSRAPKRVLRIDRNQKTYSDDLFVESVIAEFEKCKIPRSDGLEMVASNDTREIQ